MLIDLQLGLRASFVDKYIQYYVIVNLSEARKS